MKLQVKKSTHTYCRRCGRKSLNKKKRVCSFCNFPKSSKRK